MNINWINLWGRVKIKLKTIILKKKESMKNESPFK